MDNNSALLEAFRRRAGGQPSSAGISGGAPVANAQSSANPLMGMNNPNPSMSKPGMDQLSKSQPGEAQLILKALTNRLRQLPPQ